MDVAPEYVMGADPNVAVTVIVVELTETVSLPLVPKMASVFWPPADPA